MYIFSTAADLLETALGLSLSLALLTLSCYIIQKVGAIVVVDR